MRRSEAALAVATRSCVALTKAGQDLVEFVIIGMGRYGGRNSDTDPDADVMFMYRGRRGIDDKAASGCGARRNR